MAENTAKKVVLGVTGGIAAYKAAQLVSDWKKRGTDVRVILTENARRFVDVATFEALSANPVHTDTFARRDNMAHIALSKWADVFVVAPATANFLGKYAAGIADDLLTTTALAMTCPVLVAPAMNCNMWRNPAVRENVGTLRRRGVFFAGPDSGRLACGDEDVGRMSEPGEILREVDRLLFPKRDFAGRRVLVTAGPTVERMDPVRFLTNRSSGKMGYALAEAARDRGAAVTLVSGPVQLAPPAGMEVVKIESAKELCQEVLARAGTADVVLQAAAPADFRPAQFSAGKIKKTGAGMTLQLEATTDIARELGLRKRPGQILVAFAAETDDLLQNACAKLERKNADLIVANDVTREGVGFAGDTNAVTLITRDDKRDVPLLQKREVADRILDRVQELL